MANRPVNLRARHRLCIVCEGHEEELYLRHLLGRQVWSDIYDFTIVNAKGEGNVPARFQYAVNRDIYEVVLAFCDTDRSSYRQYLEVKEKIDSLYECGNACAEVMIYANPCSMQIILSHFAEVSLRTQGKKTNARLIETLTGIKDYKGSMEQIQAICSKMTRQSYDQMKQRIAGLDHPDNEPGSTNFIRFALRFEASSPEWIQGILSVLDQPNGAMTRIGVPAGGRCRKPGHHASDPSLGG